MNSTVTTIIVLAIGTYALKAAGPIMMGGNHQPPQAMERVALLLPACLLAALIVSSTVIDQDTWTIDARLAGLSVAALALWAKAPLPLVLLLAAVSTAAVRMAASA